MGLELVPNPAYSTPHGNVRKMARHGGLPRDIVKRYGVSKKAWAVYRGRHKSRNPRRRHARRRNPTGHALSGPSYRPRFKVTRSGVRHGPRFAAVPQRRRLHRAPYYTHHRRVRHNPAKRRRSPRRSRRGAVAFGRSSITRSMSKSGIKGFLGKYVPLVSPASRHVLKTHKGYALLGVGTGLIVVSVVGTATGGSVAGLLVTFGTGIALRILLKSDKSQALASGFVVGGLIAVGLNILSSGSLTGTAKLGQTLPNLKRLAARVSAHGLKGVGDQFAQGLFAVPTIAQVGKKLGLPANLKLPALMGARNLGDYFNGETYNPVTQVGIRGLGRNSQGWGVPAETGF